MVPLKIQVAIIKNALFISHLTKISRAKHDEGLQTRGRLSPTASSLRPVCFASAILHDRTSRRKLELRYGMGGFGTGATPQTADAQEGRGGVGIRNSLPWVAAEPP